MQKSMDRKNIFLIWLFGSIILMLITACVSMVVWNFNYQPEPDVTWKPINHISGMVFFVPVGWLLSFTTLFGWINICFMGISVFIKFPYILIGSAIATVVTGAFWPMVYVTMQKL